MRSNEKDTNIRFWPIHKRRKPNKQKQMYAFLLTCNFSYSRKSTDVQIIQPRNIDICKLDDGCSVLDSFFNQLLEVNLLSRSPLQTNAFYTIVVSRSIYSYSSYISATYRNLDDKLLALRPFVAFMRGRICFAILIDCLLIYISPL